MTPQPEEKLKSAEEWAQSCANETVGQYFVLTDCRVVEARKVIEKYLLNAYRAGMRRAAEVVRPGDDTTLGSRVFANKLGRENYKAILTLSQTITTEGMK